MSETDSYGQGQYARFVWEKRFNAAHTTSYVGDGPLGSLFAVNAMGSVTFNDPADAQVFVEQMREHLNDLEAIAEKRVRAAQQPPKPARRAEVVRQGPRGPRKRTSRRDGLVRRCQQPSTKNATGPDAHTTCYAVLDSLGHCPEASKHVEL